MRTILFSMILTMATSFAVPGDLADFDDCVKPPRTDSVCYLNPGVWLVSGTHVSIQRSNVTLMGLGGATLKRAPGYLGSLMGMDGGAHANVLVQNLIFDGNRYQITTPGGTLGCGAVNFPVYEIAFTSAGQVGLDNITVINALSHGLQLGGNYSYVTNSKFGQVTTSPSDPTKGSRNTAIELSNTATNSVASFNYISYAGGAGISLRGTTNTAYGNILYRNRYELTDGVGGGQIYVNDAYGAAVAANTIDANYWHRAPWDPATHVVNGCPAASGHPLTTASYPHGIEASGDHHHYYNNHILRNLGWGMLIRNQEGGSPTTPTSETWIQTDNPWVVPEPRQFVELNGGCVTLPGGCFAGNGFPVGGIVLGTTATTGPINNVMLKSVRVRNNTAPGLFLGNNTGWTGDPNAGFFPLGPAQNTCLIGSGTQYQYSGSQNRYKAYSSGGTFVAMTTGTASCPSSGPGTY